MSKNQMKEVRIEPVLNGWIVRIGCASVVALNKEAMLSEIGRYIDDPGGVTKEYAANAVNQGTYQPDEEPRPSGQDRVYPAESTELDAAEDVPERAAPIAGPN